MKKTLSSATLFACCGAYSNIIFMGQPLIKALYGEKGLIFCVAVMFVSTLYLFTICSILLSLGTDKMKDSAKVLKDSFLIWCLFQAPLDLFALQNPLYCRKSSVTHCNFPRIQLFVFL